MSNHNDNICLAQRIYYRPIEAAIRWAGLVDEEADIFLKTHHQLRPSQGLIPEWPFVFLYNERIFDALINKELPYGRNGVTEDTDLNDPDLTVRHVDLKRWIATYYPYEKPSFLFSETERKIYQGIDAHTLQFILANNHILHQNVSHQAQTIETLEQKCKAIIDNPPTLKERSESTYLSIIGAMLDMLIKDISIGFTNQESIIDALLTHFPGHPGLSERTLRSKFAAAKRKISTEFL